MLTGKLDERNGKLYVVWTDYLDSSPVCRRLWWKVISTTGNPYSALHPEAGDSAVSKGHGTWNTHRPVSIEWSGSVQIDGAAEADHVEETSVPAPKIRKGTEIRWKHGKWEKYSKRQGWISA